MLGTVPTSVPQFILLGNWLLEGKFKIKWKELKENKLFWILSSVLLTHVFGLLYTADYKAGWDDVRTKIPLMYLPLVYFTTKPLSKEEFKLVLNCFIVGSLFNVVWCSLYKLFMHQSEQIREVSRFMSHIRLGFLVDLAIVFSLYFSYETENRKLKFGYIISAFVLLFSLFYLGLASGLINLLLLFILFMAYVLLKRKLIFFFSYLIVITGLTYLLVNYLEKFYHDGFEVKSAEVNIQKQKAASGRLNNPNEFTKQIENGYLVCKNVQEYEVIKEWNRREVNDTINLAKGINIDRFFGLLRYLSSKGLVKDSVTVSSLTTDEISLIKKGITNINYTNWNSLKRKVYELMYEYYDYKNNGTINGHSFTMRFFYMQAALIGINDYLPFGIGTGDVKEAMDKSFNKMNIPLDPEWQKRPHNQFITITLANGLHGIVFFLVALIYPMWFLRKELSVLYWIFITSVIISFLFEDTLETQIGLSFYAVFNTLFITQAYFKKKQILAD